MILVANLRTQFQICLRFLRTQVKNRRFLIGNRPFAQIFNGLLNRCNLRRCLIQIWFAIGSVVGECTLSEPSVSVLAVHSAEPVLRQEKQHC